MVKVAAASVVTGEFLWASPAAASVLADVAVPNNFHALIHVTNPEGMQYAYSALQTMAEHYSKAKARLIIDGSAVDAVTTPDGLSSLEAASKSGVDIAIARDALEINGIDPKSLPDFLDAGNPGIILVVDALVKGFHYYKL